MIYIMVSIFYTSHPENYSVLPAIASENQGLYSVSHVLDRNVVVVFFNLECFFFLIWNTFWPSPLEGINTSLFSFIFWESCSDTEARSKSPILLLQSIERVKQSGNTVQFISQDAAFGQLTFLTTESGTHL